MPGLVLEVCSEDDFIHFVASDIQKLNEDKLENPFKSEIIDFNTYEEFRMAYEKKYLETKNGILTKDGKVIHSEIPKGELEIYIH